MKETRESKDQQLTVALCIQPISMAELEKGATLIAHKVDDQEDASSPEQDTLPCIVDSSTEDLLSIDSALQGSEYYKDLGFPAHTEMNSNMPLRLDWTSQETSSFCSSAKKSTGSEEILASAQSLDTPASFEMSHRYLEEVCPCPCSSENQGSFVKGEQEQPLHEEGFPVLTRSMSTSRRHSWEGLQSPTDAQRRCAKDRISRATLLHEKE